MTSPSLSSKVEDPRHFAIDITPKLDELARRFRESRDPFSRQWVLAILNRWRWDGSLTLESRKRAQQMLKELSKEMPKSPRGGIWGA